MTDIRQRTDNRRRGEQLIVPEADFHSCHGCWIPRAYGQRAGLAAVTALTGRCTGPGRPVLAAKAGPARRAAVLGTMPGAVLEAVVGKRTGTPRRLMRATEIVTFAGPVVGGVSGRRSRPAAAGGAALPAGSACPRSGIFHAGGRSAKDPRHKDPRHAVVPRRERLREAET